jgi:hypothetical protein
MSSSARISVANGFFNHPNATHVIQNHPKKSLVNVGSDGDSNFRAVAAANIDNVLSHPQGNRTLLARLFERHNKYFPSSQQTRTLLRPDERLREMVNTPYGMAKLIREFAYTLRQMTVDELCSNPEYYRRAFVNQAGMISPANLRQESTPIGNVAITALANHLQLPITVNEVRAGKELPLSSHYGPKANSPEASGDEVQLRLQQSVYVPALRQPDRFKQVSSQRLAINHPVVSQEAPDPDTSVNIERIKKGDERLVKHYLQNLHRIGTMVSLGELTKDHLLTTYIKGVSHRDDDENPCRYDGVEHGLSDFFDEATAHINQKPFQLITLDNISHEDQVMNELVCALARAISIGQLDDNLLFEQVEGNSHQSCIKVS